MADIQAFRGIRYNPEKVSIGKVVSKPYDKISDGEQDAYYQADPHNIVRLILGKQSSDDTATDNRYTRAAAYVQEWLDNEVLIKEDKPALYVYDQQFTAPGYPPLSRRAVVALGKVMPYEAKVIFPHEKTLSGPKKDRLALTRATHCQFGQLFMLYDDPENAVNNAVDQFTNAEPDYSFTDGYGVKHTLYIVTDEQTLKTVHSLMNDRKLLIADGHHRYETALNFANEMKEQNPDSNAFDYHLMSFVNTHDPGLVILPTHRVVKNVDDSILAGAWDKIGELFDVERVKADGVAPDLLAQKGPMTFGCYIGKNEYYTLSLRDDVDIMPLMTPNKPDAWYKLPVVVLHDVILDNLLGIGFEQLAAQTNVTYAASVEGAVKLVDEERHQLAFFVTPTPIDKVLEISFSGETMPQKSTDFYPKLYTGMVFNQLDGAAKAASQAE